MIAPTTLAGRRVLVTGASGLLGFALTRTLLDAGANVAGTWSTREIAAPEVEAHRYDLTDASAVDELFSRAQPEVVIHAAALTDIALCESQPELAEAVNVTATAQLAAAAAQASSAFIYVSSEAVYGDGPNPHREGQSAQPLTVYARTKLAGETAALEHAPEALVLRTTIVGTAPSDSRSLVSWLLQSFRRGTSVRGFQDVTFSPLFTADFSRLLIEALEQKLSGVWNLGGGEACSKFDFARRFATALGFDPELVQPGKLADAALRGPRCYQSALDSSRIAARLDLSLPSLDEGLERFAATQPAAAISHA